MFGKGITIFKILGFEIRIDASWIFIAILVTWSLAIGFFPTRYGNLSTATYWWMGIFGALGLFSSVVFHELFHSLVARRFGLPIRGITLFIFGGVSEIEEEPRSAKAEFFVAIIGPLSSIFLGALFFGFSYLQRNHGWSASVFGVFAYISWINFILAAFNMVPAFPLDGGRVLRSALWQWKNNLIWATHISSWIGSTFGLLLIFLGIFAIFMGSFVNGIWYFLIGVFLRNASQMSYQQQLLRKILEGETVMHFMTPNPVSVPPSVLLSEFVNDYVYKYHYQMFPVVFNDELIGCISTDDIKGIPRQNWKTLAVRDIITKCSLDNTTSADSDAMKAFLVMTKNSNDRLLVIEKNKLIGIVTLKDILQFFTIKLSLEGKDFEK